jgi:lipopolysaccharide/colanic/teichoic acid biosynthesis glycosyltransferase
MSTSVSRFPFGYFATKRAIDILISSAVLLLLSPLLVIVALAVRLRLGAPVFFIQARAGRHGAAFHLVKFRTMTDEKDTSGQLLSDADRLTPFGSWLRSTSLDELPNLFNVLRGDMSLVGPRPLHERYTSLYTPRQALRLNVPAGITGWAQINGRNTLSWEEKFELDSWYVENCSTWLDLKILFRTIPTVLRRAGISQQDHATASEFLDNNRL